jgi:hypothetical protein
VEAVKALRVIKGLLWWSVITLLSVPAAPFLAAGYYLGHVQLIMRSRAGKDNDELLAMREIMQTCDGLTLEASMRVLSAAYNKYVTTPLTRQLGEKAAREAEINEVARDIMRRTN